MAHLGAPDILFSRMGFDDSHTLSRYLATGGYEGLKAALQRSPEDIVEEVKTSGLRGRGGAGFGTGQKWGFLPPDVMPPWTEIGVWPLAG